MDDFDLNEDIPRTQVLHSKTHTDHVYLYSGQTYSCRESTILKALNELSRDNCMILQQRQMANRDVRILLPNSTPDKSNSKSGNNNSFRKYRKTSESSSKNNEDYNEIPINNYSYNTNTDNLDDEELTYTEKVYSHNIRQIENKNYNTFLYNFNQLATACYLKTMKASGLLWSEYSIDEQIEAETDFYMINKTTDRSVSHCLNDQEFIRNYVDLMVKMHHKVVNKLYKILNTPIIRVHFNNNINNTSNHKQSDRKLSFSSSDDTFSLLLL